LAIGQFQIAEKLLANGLNDLCPNKFFSVSPIIVMHQLHLAEGGLSEIEERVLKELALGVGARKVHVWQGLPLTKEQVLSKYCD
jgi:rod shape-determining protein MreB and related proteins